DAGGRIERTRGRVLRQRACRHVEGQVVAEREDRAMTLIDEAWSPFLFAEARNDALIGSDAVAVRLECVVRFRKRVTERSVHARVAAIADLRLQSVVIGLAEIH